MHIYTVYLRADHRFIFEIVILIVKSMHRSTYGSDAFFDNIILKETYKIKSI